MADILIKRARLGYPKIFTPEVVTQDGRPLNDSRPRYTANVHIPDDGDGPKQVAQLKQMIADAIKAKWPDPNRRPAFRMTADPMTWFNKNHKTGIKSGGARIPLVWGPAEWPGDPNATGWVLLTSAAEKSRPECLERRGNVNVPVTEQAKVYPGVECHAHVSIYGYAKGDEGIACGLNGVLLTGNEVGRFDNRPTASQMFASVSDDELFTESEGPDPFADTAAASAPAEDPFG